MKSIFQSRGNCFNFMAQRKKMANSKFHHPVANTSCLGNPMDGGAWWATQSMGSRRVGHDWVTSLLLFTFMHWRRKWQPTPVFLPGESQGWEPGGLPSMGSHRVGHDWCDLAAGANTGHKKFLGMISTQDPFSLFFPMIKYRVCVSLERDSLPDGWVRSQEK